jgi:putative transposase
MRMVLCDGKHFRAGATQVRRVVFSYLDDATRKVIAAICGSAEDRSLFLRGLMKVIRRAGLMDGLYLDRGPAFTAHDTTLVCARLGIPLLFGRVRYPPGHGKIEKFNQTVMNDLLRGISADKGIDPSFAVLELMIEHYLTKMYNPRSHEGLGGASPDFQWDNDPRELRIIDDLRKVEDHFIVTETRRVSRDNIVMLDGEAYEMPRGHRGRKVQVFRHFLDSNFTVLHEGRHLTIQRVDLHANARDRRAKTEAQAEPVSSGQIRTAAQRAFTKDFASVVSPDGDFYNKE